MAGRRRAALWQVGTNPYPHGQKGPRCRHERPHQPRRTPITQKPVAAFASRWHTHGGRAARDALIERFLPLARKLAARYANPHEQLDELVQVASLWLVGAVDRFDPSRGVAFATYAVPTILGELKRYFRDTGWSVHVPRGAKEMALRVDHATRRLTADLGRAPRVHELAQYLELPPGDVLDGLEAGSAQHATSLETPVSDAEDQQPEMLADTIGHVDDGYELIETTAALADGMALLPRLERRALILRMGKDMRQVEIARELGCSQMQVSRLLRRASARLHTMIHPQVQPPTQPPDVPTSN